MELYYYPISGSVEVTGDAIYGETLTATISGSVTKTYDSSNAVPESNNLKITFTGTVNNETPSVTADYSYASTDVGTGITINVSNIALATLTDRYQLADASTSLSAKVGTIEKASRSLAFDEDSIANYNRCFICECVIGNT